MIEHIRLENFQSHRESEIQLSEGLNVVVGSSDSGKTAILRAMNMVMGNKPSGESLISHWAKRAGKVVSDLVVRMKVDGKWIERRRGKGNSYALDEDSFKAMGSDVPEPIEKFLNMSEVNVQNQHDSVFLLSKSGGEIGRQLNRVVHLDKIDAAISEIDSRRRLVVAYLKTSKPVVDDLVLSITSLSWVDEAEKVIDKLEGEQAQLHVETQRKDGLSGVVMQAERIDLAGYDWIPEADRDVRWVEEMGLRLAEVFKSSELLLALLSAIEGIQIDKTDYSKASVEITLLEEVQKEAKVKGASVDKLVKFLGEVRSSERFMTTLKEDLEKVEAEFHDLMPDECPLCGRSG